MSAEPRSTHRRLPDHPLVPALAALVLAAIFTGALLIRAGGDASLLVHAGPPWTERAEAPGSLTVQEADRAFDGQFFYRLGVSPWSTDETVAGVTFDLPALRNARWGYGAMAWAASGGSTPLVPWALLGVNIAAAGALGALGGALVRSARRHAAWGMLLVLWPGFAYSLSLDTSELVASTFVVGGLLAARHRSHVLTAALLAGAVVVRDTTAVVAFGFAAAAAVSWWRRRRDHPTPAGPLIAGLAPLAVFALWQLLQRVRFGELPLTSSGDNNLSAPLAGLGGLLAEAARSPGGETLFRAAFAIGVIALLGVAAFTVVGRGRAPDDVSASPDDRFTVSAERWAWLWATAVVVVLNAYLWSGATAFMRATTEAGLLSIILVLTGSRTGSRLPAVLATGLGSGWLLIASVQLGRL